MKLINKITVAAIALSLISFQSCKRASKPVEIDFTEKTNNDSLDIPKSDDYEYLFAVSALISPRESFIYYQDLIAYMEKKTNKRFKIIQRKTYQEVNLLLRNNKVEFAFICSGAYVVEKDISNIKILAVPVCDGKNTYHAYIIVNKKSKIDSFEQLRNKSFAFTDNLSNTGKFYPTKRLNELNTTDEEFFSKTIYTHGHDISMQMVSKNIIDGASVDGLIYDYIAKFTPERVANLKIIEKSEEFGIPPIVIPNGIDKDFEKELKSVLFNMHKDPEGKKILAHLLIDKFEEGEDYNYNSVRAIQKMINE